MTDEEYRITQRYEMACRNLNARAWEHVMLPSEQLSDLQAMEDFRAMKENRLAGEVRMESLGENEYGYAQGLDIVINKDMLEKSDISYWEHVNTLFHEGEHVRQFQALIIPEVAAQYSQEELVAISEPVPDPEMDFNGYYNSAAEISAREAGYKGIVQTAENRETILAVDQEYREEMGTRNQILETYEYCALGDEEAYSISAMEMRTEATMENAGMEEITTDLSQEGMNVDMEMDYGDFGMDGYDLGDE